MAGAEQCLIVCIRSEPTGRSYWCHSCPHLEHPWPRRVERVLAALTTEWKDFRELQLGDPKPSALETKQLTGALVWLRNRGRVQSRFTKEGTLWRLPPS